jgi:hypothetical protein
MSGRSTRTGFKETAMSIAINVDNQPPVYPLSYRLAWKLLGWGFAREDGFWIADAYLQDMPLSKRDIWWGNRTLNVRLRRSKLEISVEPRHIARMVGVVKVGVLIAASVGLGWFGAERFG